MAAQGRQVLPACPLITHLCLFVLACSAWFFVLSVVYNQNFCILCLSCPELCCQNHNHRSRGRLLRSHWFLLRSHGFLVLSILFATARPLFFYRILGAVSFSPWIDLLIPYSAPTATTTPHNRTPRNKLLDHQGHGLQLAAFLTRTD